MSNVEDWEQKNALPPILSYVVIGAAFVMGFVFLGAGISQVWALHKSKSWPNTQGVVTQSRVIPSNGEGAAQILYRYSVGGQSYEGDNILRGLNEYSPADEKAKLRQYPLGAKVSVFYNPSNPQDACLEIGVLTRITYIMFGLGAFFIVSAAALAWRMRSGRPIPHVGYGTEPPPVIEDYHLFPKDK